jgi:hypothetical protein
LATPTPYAPFDLAQLHSQVRAAVESARDAESRALAVAQRARDAAAQAEDAARRARAGETGYRAYDSSTEQRYEGGWSNGRSGYGVMFLHAGRFAGDRYAGQYRGGVLGGVGVYSYAINTNNPYEDGTLRYEGEYLNDRRNGLGVMHFRDGRRDAVSRFADGSRYEGEHRNGLNHGYGVHWDAQGRVMQAGIWTAGENYTQVTTPLSR